jgi:protein-tyrosine phosphatase
MAVAETYENRLYAPDPHHLVSRWWVTNDLMIGGSIVDAADWRHLKTQFGMRSVLNVETEHSDEGKGIDRLSECRVPDDGSPLPLGIVRHAVSFARLMIGLGPMYVHCQMGGSRSPAFGYAILRWVHGMSPDKALETINRGKEWKVPFGSHAFHQVYLSSVEAAFRV